MSGQIHDPAALPPGKEPLVPLDRRLGGPQRRSGRGGEEKNTQPLPQSWNSRFVRFGFRENRLGKKVVYLHSRVSLTFVSNQSPTESAT